MEANDKTNIGKDLQGTLEGNPEGSLLDSLQLEKSPLDNSLTEKKKSPIKDIERVNTKQRQVNSKEILFKEAHSFTSSEDSISSMVDDTHIEHQNKPLNASEQWIEQEKDILEDADFQMPISLEDKLVSTLLGMTNAMISASAGYFVKIDKDNELYQSEKLLEIIDQQNTKNLARVLLDKEDKALLRPLVLQLFRNNIHQITPEQQLLGATVSILVKKMYTIIEIRSENRLVEEQILKLISSKRKKVVAEQNSEKDLILSDMICSEPEELKTNNSSLRDIKKQEGAKLEP